MGFPLTGNEKKLRALRNLHQGKRCFVVGNGPSLNQTNLDLLENEVSIASNAIFLLFDRTKFRPTYWTVEDHFVAQDRADEINRMRGFTKIVPMHCRPWLRPDEDTINIHFPRRYPGFPRFSRHLEWLGWCGHSVSYLNLQLAYYLGCTEVYLVGMDHQYSFEKKDARERGYAIVSEGEDPNHFDPSYFGRGYRWHEPRLDGIEEAFRLARSVFEAEGRIIKNATVGGALEVFPRVSFEGLFRGQRPKG